MMYRFWRTLRFVVLIGSAANPLRAQVIRDPVVTAAGTDSAAWQRVLTHITGQVRSLVVQPSGDTLALPWRIEIAASEPLHLQLEQQLRTTLHARTALVSDSMAFALTFGALAIDHDTARVEIIMQTERRCRDANRVRDTGAVTTVLVPRHPQLRAWDAAFSRTPLVTDNPPC